VGVGLGALAALDPPRSLVLPDLLRRFGVVPAMTLTPEQERTLRILVKVLGGPAFVFVPEVRDFLKAMGLIKKRE
jgi:hypothetical protein